jgi:calcineurin-like phosphoesterase family protein
METYYTSDWHLGHQALIRHAKRYRYCKTAREMDDKLISKHNSIVKPEDTVYHLGNVFFDSFEQISEFNGKLHLILGNHDIKRRQKLSIFFNIEPGLIVADHGNKLVMCHYPMWEWPNKFHGYIHLHGHTHGTADGYQPYAIDVGVDSWDMGPVTLSQIRERIGHRMRGPGL